MKGRKTNSVKTGLYSFAEMPPGFREKSNLILAGVKHNFEYIDDVLIVTNKHDLVLLQGGNCLPK